MKRQSRYFTSSVMRTERLSFRGFSDNDRNAVFALLSDPSAAEPAGFKALTTVQEAQAFLEGLIRDQALAVCLGDEIIGYFRAYPERMDDEPYKSKDCISIGFVIRKDRRKNGYGAEMLRFLSDELRKTHDYVFADAFIENEASNALIRKCGFQYVEDYSMYFESLGREMTCHSYVKGMEAAQRDETPG